MAFLKTNKYKKVKDFLYGHGKRKFLDNKLLLSSLVFLIIFVHNLIYFSPTASEAQAVMLSFGGKLFQSAICDNALACMPTSKVFPICLVSYCILGQSFILQMFDDYSSGDTPDGLDVLRETVLEPPELDNCVPSCPLNGMETITPAGQTVCAVWCAALKGLQSQNKSKVGLVVEIWRKASPVPKPAILLAWQPRPWLIPACDADKTPFGQILGTAPGAGLFIANPYSNIGDNCRGPYY